jgi:hypothetical protein
MVDTYVVVYLGYQAIVLVGAAVSLLRHRQALSAHRVAEALLRWSLPINIGLAGVMSFYAHTARAAETARLIGWAPGSPFQFEIAGTGLALGLVGLLCIWLRGLSWWATATVSAVFLWVAAVGHIQEIVVAQNYAPGNAGIVLYWDILMPLAHLLLLAVYQRTARQPDAAQASPGTIAR